MIDASASMAQPFNEKRLNALRLAVALEEGRGVAKDVERAGGRGFPCVLDVCETASIEAFFDAAEGEIYVAPGAAIESGPIPAGSTLVIPAECPARGSAAYYVYFDNPAAWAVPDSLVAASDARNASVEAGEGDTPAGWRHDAGDDQAAPGQGG